MVNGGDERDWLLGGFWVGDWLALPSQNRITRDDQDIVIEPKVMEVLVCLARQPGRTVTKDFFFDTVWDGTVVTDDVLSRCISELRRHLGDDSRNPTYIETIRKTGYRLIAPVAGRDESESPGAIGGAPAVAARMPVTSPDERRSSFKMWYVAAALIVVAVAIGFFAYSKLSTVPEPPPSPSTVPFTSFPGLEIQPAFSPDGKRIAFAAQENSREDHNIFVMQEGSYDPLRLTDGNADEMYPTWSPDGLFLAFVRTEDGTNTINRIGSLGGQERVIADLGGREVRGLAWSPDGRRLVMSAQAEPFGTFGIFTASVDSARLAAVTHPNPSYLGDITPAISPDGTEIAFARAITEDLQNVFVMSLQTGETRQVTSDSTSIAGIAWMPDGRTIVFATNPSRGSAIWRVNVRGGDPPQILASAGPGTSYENPSVTADGTKLAFAHRHSSLNIWRIFKPKGLSSFRARPAISSTSWDSYPDISPDGRRIAFASDQSGRLEIWQADADGSNQVKLTDTDGSARAPTWSPDGKEIAFELLQHGQTDIWAIPSEGGVPRQVTRTPFEEANPRWSRDGTAIYFASNRSGAWEIWRMSKDPAPPAGPPAQVTHSGGRFGSESPNGSTLYYVRPDTTGIWVQKLDSDTPPRQIFNELDSRDWANWAVTPSGFYFVQRKSYTPALAFYFLQSRRTIRLLTLDDVPSHPSLAVAPDFSWFAYTQIDEEGSDILVMQGF